MSTDHAFSILVADDEPDLLSEVVGYLRHRGQQVIAVPSFGDAVRAFAENIDSIALVLTDVRMPDGSGVELARLVIDQSQGKCPCLLMTGHLLDSGLDPDLKAAGVGVVDKPFRMSALYASILSTLAHR
jgi:CheY-like chemotaxis protein